MLSTRLLEGEPSQRLNLVPDQRSIIPLAGATQIATFRNRIIGIEKELESRLAATGIDEYLQSRNEADLAPEVYARLGRLREHTQDLTDRITSPYAQEILGDRKRRIEEADKVAASLGASYRGIVELRTNQFPAHPVVMIDIDGTTTDPAKQAEMGYGRTKYVDPLFPGSGPFDSRVRGDSSLRIILHAAGFGKFIEEYTDVFTEAGLYIPLRRGMKEFIEYANEIGARIIFVTTSVRPLVKSLISRIPGAESAEIYAIDPESTISTQKGDIVDLAATEHPDSPIQFVGDGESDNDVLGSHQLVVVQVLNQSSLHRKAVEEGVVHVTFNDGFGMRRNLKRSLVSRLQNPAA